MSKHIDKEKELREMHDSQASLVNALESIHTLLEKSETKLSAARKNLAGSRIDNHKHYRPSQTTPLSKRQPTPAPLPTIKKDSGTSDKEESAVPILDDIVIPGSRQEPPLLFDKVEIDTSITDIPEISDACRQAFIDKLDHIQIEMDDYLNEVLVRCMASIELELKETLSQKLQDLRSIIDK